MNTLAVQNEQSMPLAFESLLVKCNEYFIRALLYIEKVLKIIISTGPYIEEYGPMIQQFSVLYHLMKIINEDREEEKEGVVESTSTIPSPRLYI